MILLRYLCLTACTVTAFTTTTTIRTADLTTLFATTQEKVNSKSTTTTTKSNKNDNSFASRLGNSGMASAAAVATAAVNAAVAMRTLDAPDVEKSFIALGNSNSNSTSSAVVIDTDGLPLVYDKDLIQAYWKKERGALNQRWRQFVGKAVPFLTRLITLFIKDGKIVDSEIPALSRQARIDLQDLGPTFIKAGQMMSVRPDVLPTSTLSELAKLQDAVIPFDTATAIQQIESELGAPLNTHFSTISSEPVAAASLAQVYKATLRSTNETVAIKVQRPNILSTVSKDLYVLRRAAEVFQGLITRFAPQQQTNYVALLNEWAVGFYTELDFTNEAANQQRLRNNLLQSNNTAVIVPKVYNELCTRRILVSEWIDGRKLSTCTTTEIKAVTPAAQEAFLTQLFTFGFFHADPHPGNLLVLDKNSTSNQEKYGDAQLALIDCGLMASIDPVDRDKMISAVIHLANKDYAALVDDFIKLEILPIDTNRPVVTKLMDKALSPYLQGGGAKKYEEELRKLYGMEDTSNMQSQVGGFQAMTQDALTVLNDVPFSIPPYFAILGRAIVTLEGVALSGDPSYGIIMESYPFIARKLLREDRPEIQSALQEVLYSSKGNNGLQLSRLLTLLNNAAGAVAVQQGAAVVDLDAVPQDGLTLGQGLKFVLSDRTDSLRKLLEREADVAVDLLSRQILRRAAAETTSALTLPRPPSIPFLGNIFPQPPSVNNVRLPVFVPKLSSSGSNKLETMIDTSSPPSVTLMTVSELIDTLAPPLTSSEEVYAIQLADGARQFVGEEIGDLLRGEKVLSPSTVSVAFSAARVFGSNSGLSSQAAQNVQDFIQDRILSPLMSRQKSAIELQTANERELTTALSGLSSDERQRLDGIIQEMIRRVLYRALVRLSQKV